MIQFLGAQHMITWALISGLLSLNLRCGCSALLRIELEVSRVGHLKSVASFKNVGHTPSASSVSFSAEWG